MNETMAQQAEAPAEVLLDHRVERIRQIDRETAELQKERHAISEEVDKLRDAMVRKAEDAGAVVRGEYPKAAEAPSFGRL